MTHTSFPKKKKIYIYIYIKLIGRNLIEKVNIYDPKRPDTFGHTNAATYMAALQCHYTSVKGRTKSQERLGSMSKIPRIIKSTSIDICFFVLFEC